MKRIVLILLVIIPIVLTSQEVIYQKWDEVLTKHIGPGFKDDISYNSVAYQALENDQNFTDVLELLKNFDPSKLNSRNDELAFWINVYNIAAVNMIIRYDIPASIKDIGHLFKPVWKYPAIEVGGKQYTLNYIEHTILRSYNEPLIHFAIVCASLSCPDLLNTVYLPEKILSQMENNTIKFLQNSSKGFKLDLEKKNIYVSKIFNWFEDDFEMGVESFIEQYIEVDFNNVTLKYLDYNWDLNSP